MSSVKLSFTKNDKVQVDNLVTMLSKSKTELQGVEVIVAADAMKWLSSFQKRINDELNNQTPPPVPTT